jgi:hypothetical protein
MEGRPTVEDDDFHTWKVVRNFREHRREVGRDTPVTRYDNADFERAEHRKGGE